MRTMLVIPLVLATVVLSGCGPSKVVVPQEFLGTWKTKGAKKYAGTSMEITEKMIIFKKGEDYVSRNTITAVEDTSEHGQQSYDIHYADDAGGYFKLSLVYVPEKDSGYIRFKYQNKLVWRRVDG